REGELSFPSSAFAFPSTFCAKPLPPEVASLLNQREKLLPIAIPILTQTAFNDIENSVHPGCAFVGRVSKNHAELRNRCSEFEIRRGASEVTPAIHQRNIHPGTGVRIRLLVAHA